MESRAGSEQCRAAARKHRARAARLARVPRGHAAAGRAIHAIGAGPAARSRKLSLRFAHRHLIARHRVDVVPAFARIVNAAGLP